MYLEMLKEDVAEKLISQKVTLKFIRENFKLPKLLKEVADRTIVTSIDLDEACANSENVKTFESVDELLNDISAAVKRMFQLRMAVTDKPIDSYEVYSHSDYDYNELKILAYNHSPRIETIRECEWRLQKEIRAELKERNKIRKELKELARLQEKYPEPPRYAPGYEQRKKTHDTL
jgi:hypothetical protein